jgi:hypothetical protein
MFTAFPTSSEFIKEVNIFKSILVKPLLFWTLRVVTKVIKMIVVSYAELKKVM